MKKLLFFLFLGSFQLTPTFAVNDGPIVLILNNDDTNTEQNNPQRAPVRVPNLYIEDHTLSFTSSCVGCTLQLLRNDEVVYTYYIQDTEDLVLPESLSGEYEIRLQRGVFTFVGSIIL